MSPLAPLSPEPRIEQPSSPASPHSAPRGEHAITTKRASIFLVVSALGAGGAERHMMTLANRLADRFDVVFVYIKRKETLLEQLHIERLKDVQCLDVRHGAEFSAVRRLASLLDRHNADIVLCANSFPTLYAQLACAWLCRRLQIIQVHHTTIVPSLTGRIVTMAFYGPLVRLAGGLVFICDAQQRYWSRRGFTNTRVCRIYNGVDPAHFDPTPFLDTIAVTRERYGFSADDRIVGICARLWPEKAHGDLLRAVARARADGCEWKLLIIGDGPTRARIEALIDELRLRDNVRITGYLKDVRREVAACDLMALVSTAVETFSIAALEAMAMGKPMVMSDIGGAREQVVPDENGWLFPAGDIAALTDCLKQAGGRSHLSAMGAASRQRTSRLFSLDAMVENYAALIGSLRAGA